jgi:endonuclease YncB( thermonuclease family)
MIDLTKAARNAMVVFVALMPACAAAADNLAGRATVIDGDTMEIHGTRIRLWGIDAPESNQLCRGEDSLQYRCGAKAANDLDAFIAGRPVSCIPISLDQYRRTVASCSVDRTDLAEWLVGTGLAIDWPQYSKGKFNLIQRKAEHEGRGMWAGSYVEPWLYRVDNPNDTSVPCLRQANEGIWSRFPVRAVPANHHLLQCVRSVALSSS